MVNKKCFLSTFILALCFIFSTVSANSITYSNMRGIEITLPNSYAATPIGVISYQGEVQSFLPKNDSSPIFILKQFFPTDHYPLNDPSVAEGSYFSNPDNVKQYFLEFTEKPALSTIEWTKPKVLEINGQSVLVISGKDPSTLQVPEGQTLRNVSDYYVWARPEGFFILTIRYSDTIVEGQDIIQEVIHSVKFL